MKNYLKVVVSKNLFWVYILVFTISLNSCTKTLVIQTPIDQVDQELYNQRYNKQVAQIEVEDSSLIDNVFLTFERDSVIFENNERGSIYYDRIKTITINDKRRAFREGYTKGLIIGSTLGFILGAASVTFTSQETRLERGVRGGVVIGVIWAVIGGFAGKQSNAITIIKFKNI